jgi:ribosomal protein S18 acetylase RimI-like enzyme
MGLRAFKLPADLKVLVELIPPAFQYPENEAWNIQSDEVEAMLDGMSGLRRVWPLIRAAQVISPPLRDVLLGFIWEEDGKAVGLTNVLRRGTTDQWMIGNVAVLPEYRRRGIARKLVEACMALARERRATTILLDVVAGNVPAYSLYEKLGFEHFTGQAVLICDTETPTPGFPPLPDGYTLIPRPPRNWEPRYELAQRITPDFVRKFSPVEEGRFRPPAAFRVLAPIVQAAMGLSPQQYVVRGAANGQIIAAGGYVARRRQGGVNQLSLSIDPAHADQIAPHLVNFLLGGVRQASPGRRIEFEVPHWQERILQAALDAGFTRRLDMHSMGMVL